MAWYNGKVNERPFNPRDRNMNLIESLSCTVEATPEMKLACATLERNLPSLIQSYSGKFVAYHGTTRIGVDESPFALEELCVNLPAGTWIVASITESDDCVAAPIY